MHYPPTAFSKNGRPTILARGGAGEEVGTTQEPTETDLYELNTAYQCNTDTGTEVEEEPEEEVYGPGDGDDYATVIYEDYENVYADYGDFKSIIDLINSQYRRLWKEQEKHQLVNDENINLKHQIKIMKQ